MSQEKVQWALYEKAGVMRHYVSVHMPDGLLPYIPSDAAPFQNEFNGAMELSVDTSLITGDLLVRISDACLQDVTTLVYLVQLADKEKRTLEYTPHPMMRPSWCSYLVVSVDQGLGFGEVTPGRIRLLVGYDRKHTLENIAEGVCKAAMLNRILANVYRLNCGPITVVGPVQDDLKDPFVPPEFKYGNLDIKYPLRNMLELRFEDLIITPNVLPGEHAGIRS